MAKKRLYRCFHYFTRGELALWGTSTALILAFFLAYDRTQFGILAASLIGVTSLIFNAKGNPFGQLLMVCFSCLLYTSFSTPAARSSGRLACFFAVFSL